MFTFRSCVLPNNVWTLCFKDKAEMKRIFYEDRIPEEGIRIHGITEYTTSTIYLDKDLDGFLLAKTLRHELMHTYLWETGQQDRTFTEEELCDIMGVAAPLIQKKTTEILTRLREGLYKCGEQNV